MTATLKTLPLSGFTRAKSTALFFSEVELDLAFPSLNQQQKQFCNEFLAWLRDRPNQMQVLCGVAGAGKLQPLTEPVLTPKGWAVMGELRPGDFVVSKNGTPAKVLNVFPGDDLEIYKVSFSDGTFTECCIDHLWQVQSPKGRQTGKYNVMSLRDMLPSIGFVRRSCTGRNKGHYYSIDCCDPVQFEDKEVSIHPFLLGWLLGDGCLLPCLQPVISVWEPDALEVYEFLRPLCPKGVEPSLYSPSPSNPNVCRINFKNALKPILKALGVQVGSKEKSVPKEYLFNSIEKRKQLLAGLLDSDGTAKRYPSGKVKVSFSSMSHQLALDVIELVQSLGGIANLCTINREEKGIEYSVSIRLPFNPFKLQRKREQAEASNRVRQHFKRKIVSAEYLGKKDGQCLLVDNPDHLYLTRNYIVTHNTFAIKAAVTVAKAAGLLDGYVYACAPTHQAKGILEKSLAGAPIDGVSTSQSLLNLRPKTVQFLLQDEESLARLLAIKTSDRTDDESRILDWLQIKQNKAIEQVQEFVSHGSLTKLKGVRLIIVDEAGMVDQYMFGLFCELLLGADPNVKLHPDFQILFMGDPAQLPPINEAIGKAFTLPTFTELTQVMRYKGAILEYCNGVRVSPDYERLHRMIAEDETMMCLPSYQVLNAETLKEVYESDSIRFVAATNKRVAELNYLIRSLLKSGEGHSELFYESGDTILTMSAVQHDVSGVYDIECGSKKAKLEINTSTLIELGDPVLPGEVVGFEGGAAAGMTDRSFKFKSVLGTEFRRLLYRYRIYQSGDKFSPSRAICLIDPEQFGLWKDECAQLMRRARTTISKGKTLESSRGQNGASAEEVWAANGMKDWFKWNDGSKVEKWEYEIIRKQLWKDYYNLHGFADNASYSFCSTIHRIQGATVDVVVVDIQDILGGSCSKWKKEEGNTTWDTRKLLYTAASRASKQLIFMV